MKKYNYITKQFLIKEYETNEKSCSQIAKIIGCNVMTIHYKLIKYNIPRRTLSEAGEIKPKNKRIGNLLNKKVLIKLYNIKDKTTEQIAKKVKCSIATIYRYLKKYNISCNKRVKKIYYCIDCGKMISPKSGKYGKGRCKSCSYKQQGLRTKGKSNFNFKHGETLKQHYCKCGNIISYPTFMYGKGMCIVCSNQGENNSNFNNWSSFEPYTKEFNNKLRAKIRKRDNYICQKCGITEEEHLIVYGKVLSVHHIDYNKENIDPKNLTSLCKSCHAKTNYNRNYWQEYFNNLILTKEKK